MRDSFEPLIPLSKMRDSFEPLIPLNGCKITTFSINFQTFRQKTIKEVPFLPIYTSNVI